MGQAAFWGLMWVEGDGQGARRLKPFLWALFPYVEIGVQMATRPKDFCLR